MVSIDTPANIAVGDVPWGIDPDVVVPAGGELPDGPLVVQVRDAHRRPEVLAMIAALPERRRRDRVGMAGPSHQQARPDLHARQLAADDHGGRGDP